MKPAVFRLVLTSALFVGWIGYLGFQVATRPQTALGAPLVVSRPQILASKIDVIAELHDDSGKATVVEVLYPPDAVLKAGDTINVDNIRECRARRGGKDVADWQGPGSYLLPLRLLPDKKTYEVVSIPPSPSFALPPRLYPDSPETRAQYHQIAKPDGK